MTVTNSTSGTNVHEVTDGVYRINTPVQIEGGGGFSFVIDRVITGQA